MNEDERIMVEVISLRSDKKIQAIKGIRIVSGLGLKEAKGIVDLHQENRVSRFFLNPGWTVDGATAELQAHDVIVAPVFNREQQKDKREGPLPVHLLALKLFSVLDLSIGQVEGLADALQGIEDAEGSLRECVKMFDEVS